MSLGTAQILQRLAAVGILIALIALCRIALVKPLIETVTDHDDEVHRLLHLLAGYRREAAARPAVEAALRDLHSRDLALVGLIEGATPDVAAAELQSEVRQIVVGGGGEIRTEQTLPAVAAADFEKVSIRYELTIPPASLGPIAHQIEMAVPYLLIEATEIVTTEQWQPSASGGAELPKQTVRWTISGYRRTIHP